MNFTEDATKGFWTFKDCLEKNKLDSSKFAFDFDRSEDQEAFEHNEEVFLHPTQLELY